MVKNPSDNNKPRKMAIILNLIDFTILMPPLKQLSRMLSKFFPPQDLAKAHKRIKIW